MFEKRKERRGEGVVIVVWFRYPSVDRIITILFEELLVVVLVMSRECIAGRLWACNRI